MSFEVRRALPADVATLFAIRTSVRENPMTHEELAALGVTERSVARMLATGTGPGWVAETAGHALGFSMAKVAERELFALFVLPDAERRGVGNALHHEAISFLFELAHAPVFLSTGYGTRAHRFYLRRGWIEVSSEGDDVFMQLTPGRKDAV